MSAILPDVIGTFFGQDARVALVRNVLPNFIAQGLSGNRIQRLLPRLGLGLRRNVLQGLLRAAKNTVVSQDYVKHVGKKSQLNPLRFATRNIESGMHFQYIVKVIGHSTTTGLESEIIRTIESNSLLSRDAAANEMITKIESNEARYGFSVDDANTVEVWINKGTRIEKQVAGDYFFT